MMRTGTGNASLFRQHLIDPETCIRCNTCESRCPTKAISHERNYVVDPTKCNYCMRCVRPCPTGAIDNWFFLERPYAVDEQLRWRELPKRLYLDDSVEVPDAFDEEATAILGEAHYAMDGPGHAPRSASKPRINDFTRSNPALATVTGNARITDEGSESDVRHIILEFGAVPFAYLEGQSVGVIPPGVDGDGKQHAMRLYSVSSARDGERPNTNNVALTVKRVIRRDETGREVRGVASNWLCDLKQGDAVEVVGPFGSTFLMPEDPDTELLMICTGTGVAPFRGFTHRRRRTFPNARGRLILIYGARSPEELPYFGPLQKYVQTELHRELVYSRIASEREYVQDRLRRRASEIAELLHKDSSYIYVCGLRGLEDGVEAALSDIARKHGMNWPQLRSELRRAGRFHIETY
jgi:benzoyl-CoA 2,3-epoxidase subunit A